MSALRQEDAPRGMVTWAEHSAALREIENLRAELDQHREALAIDVDVHRLNMARLHLGLGRRPARLVVYLFERPRAVNSDQVGESLGMSRDVVRCYMSQIRAGFKRHAGLADAISTSKRGLYAMTPDARQWLRERVPEAFQIGGAP